MSDELINGIDVAEFLPLARSIALAFSRRGTPDADELCSIAQSALIRAAEGYRRSKGAFSPYAGTVVRNAMLSEIRRRKGQGIQVNLDVLDFDPKAVASAATTIFRINPDEEAANSDRLELLEKIQNGLENREQLATRLLAEGKSLSEIGKSLSVSKTMAHKIVHSALEKMRAQLTARKISDERLFSQTVPEDWQESYTARLRKLQEAEQSMTFNFDRWAQTVRKGPPHRSWLARLWTVATTDF